MRRKIKSDSIAFKLLVAFVISMAVQSILMSSILLLGGVKKESEKNAYEIFSEKVSGRASNLENEMNNVWINFEHYTKQISDYFTELDTGAGKVNKTSEQILNDLAPVIKEALEYTKTTGAYLILDGPEPALSSLYLKNADPTRSDDKGINTYMFVGPWSVAETMEITTAANWSFDLTLQDSNRDFYVKPFGNAGLSGKTRLLGYWSPPFKVNPQDEEVITYSVPITDRNGNPIGVFGIDISLSYLYKYLPSADFQTEDSYGYIMGMRSEEGGAVRAIITYGAMQKRMLLEGMPLELEQADEETKIYKLLNHNSEENIYASMSRLGMYYNNTPFSNEEWYLIGLMGEEDLLSYPKRIEHILISAFLISLAAGFAVALVISKWFTKFSRIIELSEISVGAFEVSSRSGKVFMTNQIPKLLNLSREQERRFSRDKSLFKKFLEDICQIRTEENNVYLLTGTDGDRWLRITYKDSEGLVRGVIEDVTDEIIQTRALKVERDYDGLTGIKNRKAFERAMEDFNGQRNSRMQMGFLMCDLNDLKQVNDNLGHVKGDEYIRSCVKSINSAFKNQQVFRIGGDEFAVILQDISAEEVLKSLDDMHHEIGEYLAADRIGELATGIAVGYAFYDASQDDRLEEVLARADAGMYADKKVRKKNRKKECD